MADGSYIAQGKDITGLGQEDPYCQKDLEAILQNKVQDEFTVLLLIK